ncbi:MAG: antitoxin Xre/MbcA/ParS toxin-binding domain-containing protein [Betaproteobacteria bacterium]
MLKFLDTKTRRKMTTPMDVHVFILQGLPGSVLDAILSRVQFIQPVDLQNAVGLSIRTAQRRRSNPSGLLSTEQSGRAWKFVEILTTAADVLGSQAEAERWLITPAMALDRRRPIDLLDTPVGVEMVEQLLGRIEYGVYT